MVVSEGSSCQLRCGPDPDNGRANAGTVMRYCLRAADERILAEGGSTVSFPVQYRMGNVILQIQ